MAIYNVTVKVEGRDDQMITVDAPHEGQARTRSMLSYVGQLSGQLVTFDVVLVAGKPVARR